DCLGRKIVGRKISDLKFGVDPAFVVMEAGAREKLGLKPPPKEAGVIKRERATVVLQALMPHGDEVLDKSAYRISSKNPEGISVFAYNFSDRTVRGSLSVAAPEGWKVNMLDSVELGPWDRKELKLEVIPAGTELKAVKIRGDFGSN